MGEMTRENLLRRCLLGAATGLGLGLLWVLVNKLFERNVCRDLDCLGVYILVYPLALAGIVTLGCVVLALTRMPRAWLVGIGGPAATAMVITLWSGMDVNVPVMLVVSTTAGYLIAALASAPRLGVFWRIAVIVATLALVPIGGALDSARDAKEKLAQLTAYGHPLYAPDLPGYQVEDPFSSGGTLFHYRLKNAASTINVQQSPVRSVAEFCRFSDCTQESPDVWRVAESDSRKYKVIRGDQLIELITSATVPDADLRKAVAGLSERPPEYFVR